MKTVHPCCIFYNARAYLASMTPKQYLSNLSQHWFSLFLNHRHQQALCRFLASLVTHLHGVQQGVWCYCLPSLINIRPPWVPAHFTSFPGPLCSRILVYLLCILSHNVSGFKAWWSCRGYWRKIISLSVSHCTCICYHTGGQVCTYDGCQY